MRERVNVGRSLQMQDAASFAATQCSLLNREKTGQKCVCVCVCEREREGEGF